MALADVTALVLAGGRGSRMGEVDKGLQPLHGKAMAAHVIGALQPQVAQLAINANRNLDIYASFGLPVWPDRLPGFAGPLAGLEAGLDRCSTEYLLTAPCDSPFLPPDLAQRMYHTLQTEGADIAVAITLEDGQPRQQPVFCLLRRKLLPALRAYLDGGGRKMNGWWTGHKVAEVHFDDSAAFRNINTLDELHSLAMPSLRDLTQGLDAYDPNALSVRQAQHLIQAMVVAVSGMEELPLQQALGRVLAADLISPIDVPAHDNSAMDGYALRGADLPASGEASLRVIGTVLAGAPPALAVQRGECARIMTGAVMPAGCDTVIPIELVNSTSDGSMTLQAGAVRPGVNRRLAGEDLRANSAALRAGRVLRPADLGLSASLGIGTLPVRRRLRVAVFSTGDELRSIGQPLDAGCIYDSNRYTILGMLNRLGCEVLDMGVVRDDPNALEAALRNACSEADAIITSGGVSAGDADYTRDVMQRMGEVAFWKLNMRPGRPLAFGRIGHDGRSAMLFGLPGNPVASMLSFYFFARDALLRMMGADLPLAMVQAPCATAIRKKPGRTEFQRAILEGGMVRLTGAQGSGILRSMVEANCIVVLPEEQGDVAAGEMVSLIVFEGLL